MTEEHVTRKLAAIFYADVAGYSRLTGEDEEGTHRLVSTYLDAITDSIDEHNGTVLHFAGDAVLADFATVSDAIICAVNTQTDLKDRNKDLPEDRKVQFRVGVNMGEVIVDRGEIFGNGVNVAARLESLAEPGGICISAAVYDSIGTKLPLDYEFMGEQSVKNIAEPVRAYSVCLKPDTVLPAPSKTKTGTLTQRRIVAIAAAIFVVVLAGVVAWLAPWTDEIAPATQDMLPPAYSDLPAVAVLPFDNLSGDSKQEYFSKGVTEDVVNALGRYSSLAVKTYGGGSHSNDKNSDLPDIGKALGAQYLVQGSVRRAGTRIRVVIRLTDTHRGTLLWSQSFDDENENVFEVQDTIARRIVGTLVTKLTRAEQQLAFAKPTEILEAYDLVLRGRERLARASRRGNRDARRLFSRAIDLDPKYSAAYAWLARAHYLMATDGLTEFPGRELNRAEDYARKSLQTDPEEIDAYLTLGRVYGIRLQLDRAIGQLDHAIRLNPSHAEAHGDRGLVLLYAGRLEEAAISLATAFAFNPNLRADYIFARGLTLYSLRRLDEAVKILERGMIRYPNYVFIPAVLVAAYGQLGRKSDAQRNAEKVKRLMPIFDPARFGSRFQSQAHYDYLAEGLRKGGLF